LYIQWLSKLYIAVHPAYRARQWPELDRCRYRPYRNHNVYWQAHQKGGPEKEIALQAQRKNQTFYESAGYVYLSSPCQHFQPVIFQKWVQNRQKGVIQNRQLFPGFLSPRFLADRA